MGEKVTRITEKKKWVARSFERRREDLEEKKNHGLENFQNHQTGQKTRIKGVLYNRKKRGKRKTNRHRTSTVPRAKGDMEGVRWEPKPEMKG